MADGNGVLTEFGAFNVATGSYTVTAAGAVTLVGISHSSGGPKTNSVSGQFQDINHVMVTQPAPNNISEFERVQNASICAGKWSGTLFETNDPGGLRSYSVSFMVATNGSVGLSGDFTGTGWMFALAPTNGVLSSFFKTVNPSNNHYNQIRIDGTLSGNAITGSFDTDSGNGTNAVVGTVTLTRRVDLVITANPGHITISWSGSGTLQSTTATGSIWMDVLNVSGNNYTTAPNGQQMYFRLRQ